MMRSAFFRTSSIICRSRRMASGRGFPFATGWGLLLSEKRLANTSSDASKNSTSRSFPS